MDVTLFEVICLPAVLKEIGIWIAEFYKMTGKKGKKTKSCFQKKSERAKPHDKSRQPENNAKETLIEPMEEVIESRSDKNGGEEDVRPSLTRVNTETGSTYEDPEAPIETCRPSRTKTYNKTLSEEEVRAERAIQEKYQRSGYLGELRKRLNHVHERMENPSVQAVEVNESLSRYEESFRKFVISHEAYMKYEDDDEKRKLMTDSYNDQRDIKLQLPIV